MEATSSMTEFLHGLMQLTLILNHVDFLNNHELSLGFLLFQMLLFSYILKMLGKLNPILIYEKVTTCFTYIEWVSGWVCVCVCAGEGEGWYNHSHPKRGRAFYQRMVMMYQPLLLLERRYLNLH